MQEEIPEITIAPRILTYEEWKEQKEKKKLNVLTYEEWEQTINSLNEADKVIEEQNKERSFGENFIDGTKGVLAAPFQAIGGSAEFVNWVINPWIGLGNASLQFAAGKGWKPELLEKEYFAEGGIDEAITPEALIPDTMGGHLNKNILAFFLNYGAAKQGFKQITMGIVDPKGTAQKMYQLGPKINTLVNGLRMEVAAGAFADVTAFDPEDGTAVDALLHHFPALEIPVISYLATDEDDSVAKIKLKQALEGAGITVGITGIIKSIGAFKGKFVDPTTNKWKADRVEAARIAVKARQLGLTMDEVKRVEADDFIGPPQAPMKSDDVLDSAKQTEVIVDMKALDDVIAGNKKIDEIDLPINHKNFRSSSDVQMAIDAVIQSIAKHGYKEKWDKVLTNDDLVKLSNMLDLEGDVIKNGLLKIDNIEEMPIRVHATKRVLQGLGQEAINLAKALTKDPKNAVIEANLSKALALIINTTDELKTAIKAAARTTQAGVIKTGASKIDIDEIYKVAKAFEGDIDSFAAKIALMDDFGSIRKAVERTWQQKTWDIGIEIYINGLLSGPFTQAINTGSTFIETFLRPAELALGGLVKADLVQLHRAYARYAGMFRGIRDTLTAVKKSFISEDLTGDVMGRIIENKAPRAFSAKNLNIKNQVGGLIVDTIGAAFRIPSRLLITSDELFKQINYRAKLHELAVFEGLEKGLKGNDLDNFVVKYEKNGFDKNGKFQNKDARQYSRENTFTSNLAEDDVWVDMGSKVQNMMAMDYNIFKTLVPFVRTPVNLWRHTVRRMPVFGAVAKKNIMDIKAGGHQAAEAIGRQLFGTFLVWQVADLTLNEKITGRGPKNPVLREAWLLNHRPYSFKINNPDGTTEWIDYRRMDPRFALVGVVADLVYFLNTASSERDRDIGIAAVASVASNLTSKTYLTGITDFITSIAEGTPYKWKKVANNYAASFIPYNSFMRQLNPDPLMREVRTLADTVNNLTWGDAEGVPPKYNMLGEVQHKQKGLFGFPKQWWAPMIVGRSITTEDSIVYNELAKIAQTTKDDVGKGISMQGKRLFGTTIDLTNPKYAMIVDGQEQLPIDVMHKMLGHYKLQGQQGYFAQYNGLTVKEAMYKMITMDDRYNENRINAATGHINVAKVKMMRDLYGLYRTQIKDIVISRNPELSKDYKLQTLGRFQSLYSVDDKRGYIDYQEVFKDILNYSN